MREYLLWCSRFGTCPAPSSILHRVIPHFTHIMAPKAHCTFLHDTRQSHTLCSCSITRPAFLGGGAARAMRHHPLDHCFLPATARGSAVLSWKHTGPFGRGRRGASALGWRGDGREDGNDGWRWRHCCGDGDAFGEDHLGPQGAGRGFPLRRARVKGCWWLTDRPENGNDRGLNEGCKFRI
jgi:hypothetical protein